MCPDREWNCDLLDHSRWTSGVDGGSGGSLNSSPRSTPAFAPSAAFSSPIGYSPERKQKPLEKNGHEADLGNGIPVYRDTMAIPQQVVQKKPAQSCSLVGLHKLKSPLAYVANMKRCQYISQGASCVYKKWLVCYVTSTLMKRDGSEEP
ncbi:hypothetical protein MDA_GLEAN10013929 [Myotis davidii]|uniref:Uncharacterized protein n=1 Tax=Myotis davidii TaxID=225400 RepID=L5LHR6_MYODS|nr:hypothetical protein MDA_GLEAN10013929 [Myotis davidii]